MVQQNSPGAEIASVNQEDLRYMTLAIKAAKAAAEKGEVPVGAVIVKGDNILAAAGNQPITTHDPTGHAEIRALRTAAKSMENYRLPGTTLYVTLEPCLMCIGAIIHARVDRLVYGATDPKTGAVASLYPIGTDQRFNHRLTITSGILEQECGELLRQFFKARR